MKKSELLNQLRQIVAMDRKIEEIFLSSLSLEEKRIKLRDHLSNTLLSVYDRTYPLSPLEWITCRDATWVLRNMLAPRSEELAGFSLLEYIDNLLATPRPKAKLPSKDFLAELEHLFKGITGKSEIYKEKPPTFLKYSGRKAAKLRSADLSRMARNCTKFLQRYPSGLEDDLVRTRSLNKQAIQKFFKISDLEWNDWRWHTRNVIRDADTLKNLIKLSDEEYRAITEAKEARIPFGITPYYASLMDRENRGIWDKAIRAQVIPPLQYVDKILEYKDDPGCSMDFMVESDTSPIDCITRRYPSIVILKPILTCPQICVYCQRNWQIEDIYSQNAVVNTNKLNRALQWIEQTPEINEVLVTGGDPLLLSDEKIDEILEDSPRWSIFFVSG